MFDKISSVWALLKAGESVKHDVGLKLTQNYSNIFAAAAGAILGLAKAFGVDLHVTNDQIVTLLGAGAVVYGLFNVGATTASTDKISILRAAKPEQPSDENSEREQPVSRVEVVDHSERVQQQPQADTPIDIWGTKSENNGG